MCAAMTFHSRFDAVAYRLLIALPVLAFVTVNAVSGSLWAFVVAAPLGVAAVLAHALLFAAGQVRSGAGAGVERH